MHVRPAEPVSTDTYCFSTPRRIWSCSIDSKSARKLPSPKPSLPFRWMISKKNGADDRAGEDLQQHLVPGGRTVEQDAVAGESIGVLAVARSAGPRCRIADLAEIEQPLVERRPLLHPPPVHVVRQMVDVGEPRARRIALDAGQRHEVFAR